MSDRDRLKQLVADTPVGGCYEDFAPVKIKDILGEDRIQRVVENLLSNGVIVPPCKVGDTVFVVSRYYTGTWFIYACMVNDISVYKKNMFVRMLAIRNKHVTFAEEVSQFGKTVFLTKEEAERALKNVERV